MPFGLLTMLLFYYDHVSADFLCLATIALLIALTERQQYHGSSSTVSPQEAWWIPLGLFPSGLYDFSVWYSWITHAQRPCSTGTAS